jgi:hypothetical protein
LRSLCAFYSKANQLEEMVEAWQIRLSIFCLENSKARSYLFVLYTKNKGLSIAIDLTTQFVLSSSQVIDTG